MYALQRAVAAGDHFGEAGDGLPGFLQLTLQTVDDLGGRCLDRASLRLQLLHDAPLVFGELQARPEFGGAKWLQ